MYNSMYNIFLSLLYMLAIEKVMATYKKIMLMKVNYLISAISIL